MTIGQPDPCEAEVIAAQQAIAVAQALLTARQAIDALLAAALEVVIQTQNALEDCRAMHGNGEPQKMMALAKKSREKRAIDLAMVARLSKMEEELVNTICGR